MRAVFTAMATIVIGVGVSACGSSGYSSGSGTPTAPTPANGASVVTIDVVAIKGAQSFSPNPATLPSGQLVIWHNVDTVTHRVVLSDRSVDTGDLPPGASSQPMAIGTSGGQYHCSIHPVMVGSINQDTTPAPSCQGPYCD